MTRLSRSRLGSRRLTGTDATDSLGSPTPSERRRVPIPTCAVGSWNHFLAQEIKCGQLKMKIIPTTELF